MKGMIIFLLLIGLGQSTYAQEIPEQNDYFWQKVEENRFSIGLNNLPWNASRLSLRWWQGERKGRELTVSVTNQSETGDSDSFRFQLGEIRYDWLKRKRSLHIQGLYYVGGIGLGIDLNASFRNKSTNYLKNDFQGYFSLYFPLGIEHFFIRTFPHLSYSLQVDFYGRIYYRHAKYDQEIKNSVNFPDINEWKFSLGMKLQFFIRLYLR